MTDSITGEPLEATVFIEGHDHHGSEVGSHLPAGDYHRPIKGGTYRVTYSCEGYHSKTLTMTVADGETLVQDVRLVSDWYGGEEMTAGALRVYPNPTDRVLLQGKVTGERQRIDVSSLPQGIYFVSVGRETRRFVVR